jgi:DNA-binding transcriptional LysR family regulator
VELRQLRYAQVLAEELHFGRAARRERVTPAAFGEQIQRLERELGVKLFERSTRQVRLTMAGETVLPQICAAVAAADEVSAQAQRVRLGTAGRLVIGLAAPPIELATQVLRGFHRRYPKVRTELYRAEFLDTAAGLRTGLADVALVWAPIDDRGLMVEVLGTRPRVAVLPAGHRLAGRDRIGIGELLDEPWCGYPAVDEVWLDFWLATERRGRRQPHIGGTADSLDGMVELIATGQAVAVAPDGVHQLMGSRAVCVPVADLPPIQIAVAWPATAANPLVPSFVGSATRTSGH